MLRISLLLRVCALQLLFCGGATTGVLAQAETLVIRVVDDSNEPIPFATVGNAKMGIGASTDLNGEALLPLTFGVDAAHPFRLSVASVGYITLDTSLTSLAPLQLSLKQAAYALEDVVVTGTLAPTLRSESPVPVAVYTRTFLLSDPTPSLFDAMQNVNGVRPQLNCSICNTGDIHINGLEGPYTMVTIDGMPIVSGLGTVYGLTGIPNSLIERVEVVKGPAGSLYGSEAVGGLINVITRDVSRAPKCSADVFSTALGDVTADIGMSAKVSEHARVLTGINAHYFDNKVDNNKDNFTDLTLAKRLSIFQKWGFTGGAFEGLSLAGRYLAETRSGGELDYEPALHQGGDVKYGETIDTRRGELLARYDTPIAGLAFSGSANYHVQRSSYGTTLYDADQAIVFGQATYAYKLKEHNLLFGAATRYTYYDDNTAATESNLAVNAPDEVVLPGVFVQDEVIRGRHRLLLGMRLDYHPEHGAIYTPRVAYKMPVGEGANVRFNVGTGFRVVNLFTEDHAALTGGREVVIEEGINPERSISGNINFDKRWQLASDNVLTFEASMWLTRFSNQILPDYETNATQIRYANLTGHSRSTGASADLNWRHKSLTSSVGVTFTDVAVINDNESVMRPLLSERWSGVWGISYALPNSRWSIDYNGSVYGPMLLPLQGPLDTRAAESPWFSLQNLQATFKPGGGKIELYGGIKNLLNFTPSADAIARANDPFDKAVSFDAAGMPLSTPNNPNALVFDPSYVYASNVGRRVFLGARVSLR